MMRAVGREFATIAKRAFDDASLRPSPWLPVKRVLNAPPSKGRRGTAATAAGWPSARALIQSGLLRKSIRVISSDEASVTVGTDRPYAGYQQYGTRGPYRIAPMSKKALFWPGAAHPVAGAIMHPGISARPFFPVRPDGTLTHQAANLLAMAAETALRKHMGL